jgi:putative Mn2+ efflux pump MntP
MTALLFLLLFLLGFVVGRTIHIIAHRRHVSTLHHWVSGLLLLVLCVILLDDTWRVASVGFSAGFVVSDLGDLLKMRVYGLDKFEEPKFWDIN